MKTKLLAGVSLGALALTGGAQAADLGARPVYKAAAPVPWTWTGFYVGANVGAANARSTISDGVGGLFPWLGVPTDNNKSGVIGGLQAGLNWQVGFLVLGVEGDISFASVERSTVVSRFGGDLYSTRLDWLSTVRGRVGLAFDRLLVYGTGGAAFANLPGQYSVPGYPFTASPSPRTDGWVAGGGIEYAFADHWTARAEYLHVDFNERAALSTAGAYAFAFKDSIDIGRVGINYKF